MRVIFFDGYCGLCNGFVDFILKIDRKRKFHFCPLQSEFAKSHLPDALTSDLKSVVYSDHGNISTRSDAVIKVMNEIGGFWKIAYVGKLLPKFLCDKAYDRVAQNRYKIFGKRETCRLPTLEERSRFIT